MKLPILRMRHGKRNSATLSVGMSKIQTAEEGNDERYRKGKVKYRETKDGSPLRLFQVQDGRDVLGDYIDPDDDLLADGAYLVPYGVEERRFRCFYDMLMG